MIGGQYWAGGDIDVSGNVCGRYRRVRSGTEKDCVGFRLVHGAPACNGGAVLTGDWLPQDEASRGDL